MGGSVSVVRPSATFRQHVRAARISYVQSTYFIHGISERVKLWWCLTMRLMGWKVHNKSGDVYSGAPESKTRTPPTTKRCMRVVQATNNTAIARERLFTSTDLTSLIQKKTRTGAAAVTCLRRRLQLYWRLSTPNPFTFSRNLARCFNFFRREESSLRRIFLVYFREWWFDEVQDARRKFFIL